MSLEDSYPTLCLRLLDKYMLILIIQVRICPDFILWMKVEFMLYSDNWKNKIQNS